MKYSCLLQLHLLYRNMQFWSSYLNHLNYIMQSNKKPLDFIIYKTFCVCMIIKHIYLPIKPILFLWSSWFLHFICREWYRGFKHDCPNGQLTKQTIIDICNQILPGGNSSTFVDQIFRIFDKDNSGTIDFKEFMLATDMTSAGTAEEKLAWAFKV